MKRVFLLGSVGLWLTACQGGSDASEVATEATAKAERSTHELNQAGETLEEASARTRQEVDSILTLIDQPAP